MRSSPEIWARGPLRTKALSVLLLPGCGSQALERLLQRSPAGTSAPGCGPAPSHAGLLHAGVGEPQKPPSLSRQRACALFTRAAYAAHLCAPDPTRLCHFPHSSLLPGPLLSGNPPTVLRSRQPPLLSTRRASLREDTAPAAAGLRACPSRVDSALLTAPKPAGSRLETERRRHPDPVLSGGNPT